MTAMTISQAIEMARTHHQAGRLNEAEGIYRQILARQPDHAEVLHLLGVLACQAGQPTTGMELIRRAIAISPLAAEFHNNLGKALRDSRQLEEAVAAYRRAIQIKPNFPEAHNNLGNALRDSGQLQEAVAACRQAIQIKPNFPEAYNNLGITLTHQGKLDEALAAFRQAVHLNPNLSEAHNNLGNTLKDQGRIEEALSFYDRAITLKPGNAVFASARVFALHLHPGYSAKAIYAAHRQWSRQHAVPLQPDIQPHSNDRSPNRRLKVGYVSPDLREHPVGRFLLPLLQNHDHSQFHITGYADVPAPDEVTRRLQGSADAWRSTVGLSHQQMADLIRADGIDILVDLTMHSVNNRLPVFARKPAPVQVTYLSYCSTTGLDAIDYRLTDPYLDPPCGEADRSYSEIYSERSIWLPQTYWCYQPPNNIPDVGPLPALSAGHITFGCLNNFNKVNDGVLSVWGALLGGVPGSRLLLHASEGSHRQRTCDFFERAGVSAERLSFAGFVPMREYFRFYQSLDIGLDPFPYAGGTTTCDALWMGVPVVSLAGETGVSRGGLSILSNVGLPELVARTPDEYVQIVSELAGDRSRLAGLRSGLRERMASSPVMDEPGCARAVEAAYRRMWHNWCEEVMEVDFQ